MNAPIIEIRQKVSPYNVIPTPITYSETVANQTSLPVLSGDNSDIIYFRIYNNYGLASNIATAYNLYITTYDSYPGLTASMPVASQQWIHFAENGFGENSSPPGLFTLYQDRDLAVGGSSNTKTFTYGSDGNGGSYIRAGSGGNGVGFIETKTYAQVPLGISGFPTYPFVIAISYSWNT